MLSDLRFAARMLLKQPGFTLIAVLTLALGIGATAAVFSLIQGVLLTPPPYRDPARLVLIPEARSDGQPVTEARGWTPAQWMEWKKKAASFESLAAFEWSFNFLVLSDGSESLEGMYVTPDYFRVVGLQPMLGRTFVHSEAEQRSAPVVILGYDVWQRKFGGDPKVIGRKIRISRQDTPPVVIGVMPPGVRFLPSPTTAREPNYDVNAQVDFWAPATPDPAHLKEGGWNLVGRLRPGATPGQAQAELGVLAAQEARADHDFEGIVPRVEPLGDELNRDGRRILMPLLWAAALVLLIACGNVAALLLVRGLQRQQEYAVRSALGIGRFALLRQVSTENLLLAFIGGTFGVVLAFAAIRIFKLIGGHAIPRLDAVTAGWPVLLCGFVSALLAALVAGLVPALRASRLDPMPLLKSAGPKSSVGTAERRLLRGVTMVQTALTLALLVGAGVLIRTMINVSGVRSGYRTDHILTMTVTAVQGKWLDFHQRALERVATLPGVQGVAFAWGVPLTGNNWPANVLIEGQPKTNKASERPSFALRSVTPGYFRLLGQNILDGRDFRSSDDGKAPQVAVVNRAFVDRYFPHEPAPGKKLWIWGSDRPGTAIVGVVTNSRTDDLTAAAKPEIYLCLWQAGPFSKHLVVRTAADPHSLVPAIQRELRSIDPTVAVEHTRTLDQIRGDSLASRSFAMQLLVGFALVGSLLTLVGIYGVLSLSVASRRREIAIRTAVGAERADIGKLILTEGFRLVAGGIVAGLAGALVLTRALRSFLFEVQPADPVTLAAVALLFAIVALLACWAPARRADKVDPVEVLRYE